MIFISMIKSLKGYVRFQKAVENISLIHENSIYRRLIKNKMVYSNDFPDVKKDETYEGAYTEANQGFYRKLIVRDFTSLYPSIIMMLNISVETLLTGDFFNRYGGEYITTLDENIRYKKDREGIIVSYTKENFLERLRYKRLMKEDRGNYERWDLFQYVMKILINSLYGYLGFKKAYFYSLENASIITRTARHLIKLMKDTLIEIHTDDEYLRGKYEEINNNKG